MSKPYKGKDGVYRFNFTKADGKRTTGYGCTDLDATKRIQAKIEHDAYLARKGLVDPREQGFADAERKPIAEHISDWVAVMDARKVGAKHSRQMQKCIELIVETAKLTRVSELSPDTIQQTVSSLTASGKGLATLNRYIVSAKSFSAWLARGKRIREDALKSLEKYRAETDRKRRRRALSAADVALLVAAAERGPVIRGMSGTDRAMLYRLAVGTGFRASELASLTRESFNLDTDRPTVTVQAGHSKHRREDVQPLPKQLADLLAPWLVAKPSGERAFGMPASDNTARMLKDDLESAKIEYLTSEGVADFHSLRHTFITTLAMSGERVKVVQELARHSKPELTLNTYTHAGLHDLQGAVDRLPVAPKPSKESESVTLKATGTDGKAAGSRQTPAQCMQMSGFPRPRASRNGTINPAKGGTQSAGFTESKRDVSCQGMKWSDGESNPDLLNAIQPSSR